MREKYESLAVGVLRDLAKHRGIDTTGMKKADIVDAMLEKDHEEEKGKEMSQAVKIAIELIKETIDKEQKKLARAHANGKEGEETENKKIEYISVNVRELSLSQKEKERDNEIMEGIRQEKLDIETGVITGGILEVMPEGFGFIRSQNFLPGDVDVYVAAHLIKRFKLKTGDLVKGRIRDHIKGEKFAALLYIVSVNGIWPERIPKRAVFERLTPIFPDERIHLETEKSSPAMRIVDLVAPIGKGQRGMIVSQPKAGKTTLLKQVAQSVLKNHPDMHLIILLIDERPEEVTDIKEAIQGDLVEVIYSTFDELPDHHKRVAEMVLERGKRLVEQGDDVIVLLDSITRLARAYNITSQSSGRTLSGGLDPAALHMPKKFFGAARNMREGGSLTVLATALVDTGSKMDDVVYEEFKGTGNMELVLDRKLSEKRIFPAIDMVKSGTRREDLLLNKDEYDAMDIIRHGLNGAKTDVVTESLIKLFSSTKCNKDVVRDVLQRKLF